MLSRRSFVSLIAGSIACGAISAPAVSARYRNVSGLRPGRFVWNPSVTAEGPLAIYARHQEIGDYCRRGLEEVGCGLFAAEGYRSNTVTAATLPNGLTAKKVLEALRTRFGIVAGSTKAPGVEMIRIGHMGYVSEADLDEVFGALRTIIAEG